MTSSFQAVDSQANKQPLLTVSIVTFNPDFDELKKTLDSLKSASNELAPRLVSVTIVDNSFIDEVSSFLRQNYPELSIKLIQGHGNIGFGRAHNLAMGQMGEFHLILNPDVQLASDALKNAISFMQTNENCGLLSPYATWPDGERQYLCKHYPAIFDLILRGFAPKVIRSLFSRRLAKYELQDETQNAVYWNPPIVSGCFMFFRSSALEKIGAFNDNFFLYFEDFDLSFRSSRIVDTAYAPEVRIIHTGGHASKKGFWHIKVFIRSAFIFYANHGIRLF